MLVADTLASPSAIPPTLVGTHRPADLYGFLARAGGRLRVACWNATGTTSKGTVIVLPGRAEFIEKYATETVGELLDRGFAVQALDWRGQGLSDRALPDRDKGHIDDFETFVADLALFLESVPKQGPTIAVAHSMGGHILLRLLAERGNSGLDAAIMTAPMSGLKREAVLRLALMLIPARAAGESAYLYGSGPFSRLNRDFGPNRLTHDERRFRFTEAWFEADPRLTLGGPTTGWARQAARSMKLARQPGFLEKIDIPVVVLSAGQDRLVEPASNVAVARRLKRGSLVAIAKSRHEILMETDDIRAQFWDAFDRLAKSVAA
jgi:lysophospholipase